MTAALFIDGSYLYKVARQHQFNVDYKKLRPYLENEFCDTRDAGDKICEAYYFNADNDPPTAKANSFHKQLTLPPPQGPGLRVKLYWLSRKQLFWPETMGGGQVIHPTTKEPFTLIQQKGVDVGLAFNLMRSFQNKGWNKLFLAAGDGDFHEVVQHLVENESVSLILIGNSSSVSSELMPYASALVDISRELPFLFTHPSREAGQP